MRLTDKGSEKKTFQQSKKDVSTKLYV